ncbi:MAG: DUF6270 domain-containing protein, partial [Defluviitaleaceae bacterium]|nr:DUF6270 domain-containing protein [Defluviitaleaceae bacterium]
MIKISAFGRVASQLFNLKHGNTPILLKKSISFGWQSLASILSDPIDINDEDVLFLKDWEKNVVLSEFKKDVFEELKNSQGEFFVFDFLNERFNLIRYNDSYITSTHISKKLQCLINENVEIVYRNIFYKKNKSVIEDIMVQFSKKISEIYNPSHIIMIKAFLCEQYKDKNGNIVPFDDIDKIHKTNSMLEDMYIFMENCIPNINIIETPKNVMAEELHVSNLSSTTYSEEYLNMVYKKTENICTSISLAKINENLSAYCNNTFTTSIQSLNFYKQKYPYQDYILFYGEKGIKERLCNFAKSIGLYFYEFNTRVDIGVFLLSSRPVKFFRGKVFAFSGITKNNGKLIFGDEDIIDAIDNYTNEIGEYTLIIENENHVDIINDYFGISKTFYYNKNKLAIMSNRYHLLLLLLKNLNITLKLKFDQCAFYLTLDKVYSQQAFFRDLPIKDTYILPIDQSIRIVKTEKNLLFLKTKLHNVLHNPKTFNKHDYTFKLQQAADEILENVKIILQDNRFDYSIIDLTGGMDSRLVYSAIAHFPEYKEKIRIHTYDDHPATGEADLPVAFDINNIYNYKWSDLSIKLLRLDTSEMENNHFSYFLGSN